MSAIKSDFRASFLYETAKLEEPWKFILPQLETMPVEEMMSQIGKTSLVVSGVYVRGKQLTFEDIAGRISNESMSHFLYVLYGVVLSVSTGTVHKYLREYMCIEWVPWVLSASVSGDPLFVLCCRRSLKPIVEWMVKWMEKASNWEPITVTDSKGDCALHIAVDRHQWDWAKWLISRGCSPYMKNIAGHTPMMLSFPNHERLDMFCLQKDNDWFSALHGALMYGRNDSSWCIALIDRGADVNQLELYDAPIDCLVVFAKNGMDMNLGPLPLHLTADQLKLFYAYGHKPKDWSKVIDAFEDASWIYFLHSLASLQVEDMSSHELFEEYRLNVQSRQCITNETRNIIDKM